MPAPSPITKPSRSASNGREAFFGSSLRVESARIEANPATDIGVIALSAPPQIIASASPRSIMRKLSPMACAPAAQAVAVAEFGPFAPCRIETLPEARLTIDEAIKNGETRSGPPDQQFFVLALDRPEIADARTDVSSDHFGVRIVNHQAAVLDGFVRGGNGKMRESAHSPRFLFFEKIQRVKIFDLAGEFDRKFLRVELLDIVRTALAAHQARPKWSATSFPHGVTNPSPVTTTRRFII